MKLDALFSTNQFEMTLEFLEIVKQRLATFLKVFNASSWIGVITEVSKPY